MYMYICTYVAAKDAAVCVGGELRRGPSRGHAVGGEPRSGPGQLLQTGDLDHVGGGDGVLRCW